MARNKKIKHYRRSFYSRRVVLPRILLAVAGIALVFVVGWLAGPRLLDYGASVLSGLTGGKPAASQLPASSTPADSQPDGPGSQPADSGSQPADSQPSDSQPQPPDSEPESTVPGTAPITTGKWRYMDSYAFTNENAEQLAAQLAADGIQYAVITLKGNDGTVYCTTQNETAARFSKNRFDLTTVAAALESVGVTPVARICAFKDPAAGYGAREMAIHYLGTEDVLWLDNSPEAGGKPWLNPYSPLALGYVESLMQEARQAGFDMFVLPDVRFADIESYVMNCGPSELTHAQQLEKVIADWTETYGSSLWLEYTAYYCDYNTVALGWSSPDQLGAAQLVINGAASTEALERTCAKMRQGGCTAVVGIEGSEGWSR